MRVGQGSILFLGPSGAGFAYRKGKSGPAWRHLHCQGAERNADSQAHPPPEYAHLTGSCCTGRVRPACAQPAAPGFWHHPKRGLTFSLHQGQSTQDTGASSRLVPGAHPGTAPGQPSAHRAEATKLKCQGSPPALPPPSCTLAFRAAPKMPPTSPPTRRQRGHS